VIDYHELRVWEKAHQLTHAIYKASFSFPKEELYGLTSQIRRDAISIPKNLAEGCVHDSQPELLSYTRTKPYLQPPKSAFRYPISNIKNPEQRGDSCMI